MECSELLSESREIFEISTPEPNNKDESKNILPQPPLSIQGHFNRLNNSMDFSTRKFSNMSNPEFSIPVITINNSEFRPRFI